MDLIKRHKGLAIVGGLTLILVIIMFAIFARMIFSTGETQYGNRLRDIVKLDGNTTNKIIEELYENEAVEDITIRTQGKIIYTTIKFKEGTKQDKAKEIANSTLERYEEDVIKCYDFEFFLKENVDTSKDEEKKGFVIAGTKHPKKEKISWTTK